MHPGSDSIIFRLRGVQGRVEIAYGVNDDPLRWGYGLLNVGFDTGVARGFPVMLARAQYSAEGYAGLLGWVQVVDYTVLGQEQVWVAPDVAPQARDANTPYTSFGIEPVIFDAPAFTEQNVNWTARTFLTYTPDCLMTPVVEPLCGFCWGYVIRAGTVTPKELRQAAVDDWMQARRVLRLRLPTWTFGGENWDAPALDRS